MKIICTGVHIDLTPSFVAYAEEKLGTLGKLVGRLEDDGELEVHLTVTRTTVHHHKGEVFEADGRLHLPARTLRVAHRDTNARKAVDMLKVKLRLELEKYKEIKLKGRKRQKDTRL